MIKSLVMAGTIPRSSDQRLNPNEIYYQPERFRTWSPNSLSPCALVVVSFKVKCRLSDSADTIISGPSHTHRTSGRTKSSKTVYTTCPPSLYTRPGRGQHSGARGYSQMRSCAAQGPFDPGLSRVRLQDGPGNPVPR